MTTITFKENIHLDKTHFESVESFLNYLEEQKKIIPLTEEHKAILDKRLKDHEANPNAGLTLEELKGQITRKTK